MGLVMADSAALRESIVRIVAIELKVPEDRVRSGCSLRTEVGFDSIAAANVTFMIEEEWGVEIEIRDEDQFDTVDQILTLVQRSLR
jgi:acyl carrier protein